MSEKIAVKRLTRSDLTFFKWHFENAANAGNQKAINLNRNPFVDKLFPALPEVAEESGGKIPVNLSIFGPGFAPEYSVARKIIKSSSYKNWRLDGEFIVDPDDSPARFRSLQAGDLVLFVFSGAASPVSVSAFFISRHVEEDEDLHRQFDAYLGNDKMKVITRSEVDRIIMVAAPNSEHPINGLTMVEDLEDASQGGALGTHRLLSRAQTRRVSRSDLTKARASAELVGQQGEEFVRDYFQQLQDQGEIESFEWTASLNAVSPYDFSLTDNDGQNVLVEVKSTRSEFECAVHISYNELRTMAVANKRYDLYRVFNMAGMEAQMAMARNLKPFAVSVLHTLELLPEGITVNSISICPSHPMLTFEERLQIRLLDEIEGEDEIEADA
jgi:hypothetical protein